jgi:hypothetical protein
MIDVPGERVKEEARSSHLTKFVSGPDPLTRNDSVMQRLPAPWLRAVRVELGVGIRCALGTGSRARSAYKVGRGRPGSHSDAHQGGCT